MVKQSLESSVTIYQLTKQNISKDLNPNIIVTSLHL